jgi:hypothetical protein
MRIPLLLFVAAASCFAQVAYPGGTLSAPAYYANPPFTNAFPGSRLNDATGCATTYTGGTAANHAYVVRIQTAGTPDTIEWQKDGGSWSSPINVTGACQTLTDGVGIKFAATTGHTAGYVPTMAWIPSFAYIVAPAYFAIDAAQHKQLVIVAGTSCGSTPTWNDSGGTTTDCGVTWQDDNLDPPWNNYDQWTFQATINGSISAAGTSRQNGSGVVFRSAFQKLNDLLLAGDFPVDSTCQTDSTSALQAMIYQSRVKGQAAIVSGGCYAISGSGLQMIDGGEDLRCQSNLGCTLLMKTAGMTGVTVMGYENRLAGFRITPVAAATGTTGVLVTTSAGTAFPGATQNTEGNRLDDLYILGSTGTNSGMAAGVLIIGSGVGEVVYTQGHRVHVQGAIDAWKDSTTTAEINSGFQNNANWCTDCNFEQSARCIYLNGVGEDHFDGLSLNGCNGIPSVGTVAVTNGSTAVVGTGTTWTAGGTGVTTGAPFYAGGWTATIASITDATHLTLSAGFPGASAAGIAYGIGENPIVIDSTTFGSNLHVPSAGNVIHWNTGEPVQTLAIFDPYAERNLLVTPNVAPGGSTTYDMTGGKNSVLSNGGNFLASYDLNGFPQVWLGAVAEHTATAGQSTPMFATVQIGEAFNAGSPGKGQNTILRLQTAASFNVGGGPASVAWMNLNPYGYRWVASFGYQVGMIVVDPSQHIQRVIVAGTSGSSTPTWNDSGGRTTDGGVTYQDGAGGGGGAAGLYLNTAPNVTDGTIALDSQRTDIAGATGGVDLVRGVDTDGQSAKYGNVFAQPVPGSAWSKVTVNARSGSGAMAEAGSLVGGAGLQLPPISSPFCGAATHDTMYPSPYVSGTASAWHFCGQNSAGSYVPSALITDGTLNSYSPVFPTVTASSQLNFKDQTTPTDIWTWYSVGNVAYLYSNTFGNLLSVNPSTHVLSVNGVAFSGYTGTKTRTACTTITGGAPSGCSNVTETYVNGLLQ